MKPEEELKKMRNADRTRGKGRGSGRSNSSDKGMDIDLLAMIDHLAWDYIPSAIDVHGNITWNFGGGIEANYTPIELMFLANWRSGEISLMVSTEGSAMLTVPDLVGVSLNGGITEVYGASSNSSLKGWSNFSGYSVSFGEGVNVGASQIYGTGKKSPWELGGGDYIDPVSNHTITYRQSAIFGSANIPILPTPVDGSVFVGKSYTSPLISISSPNWSLR